MKSEAEIFEILTGPTSLMVPAWVRNMPKSEVEQLKREERFRCEEKVLNASYIEFLDIQIDIEPRGPEWTASLRRRRQALLPHVGKNILSVTIGKGDNIAIVRIDPETSKVIFAEDF